MEKFLNKFPSKMDFAIGLIFGISLFFAYRVGLNVEEKWPYVLLLILSIVIYKISYDSLFMKLVAVVNILYSVFMFMQQILNQEWLYSLKENTQAVLGIIFFVFVILGNLMATASGIFVLFFGIIAGASWRLILYVIAGIPQFLCTFFWSKIRGPIPDVQCIVKGDKRVYLQKDFRKKQIQLIYRHGSKKKILDTYQWEEFSNIQYSLKKHGTNCMIVEKYSTKTFKQIEEKKYTIKVLW